MGGINGQVVVVTGASSGLGREMALRFSREGARVTLASRNVEKLEAVASESVGETMVARTDITVPSDIAKTVEKTVERFGRIDTLVNNAGIGLLSIKDHVKRLDSITLDEWRQILDTNLTGTFLCTKAVLPQMSRTEQGTVINITSKLGRNVFLIGDSAWAPYTVSKWGIEALTKITALEYADDGITANALDPGGRATTDFWEQDTWPDDREVETFPSDVMNDAAVLLAEQGSDGISGESKSAAEWEATLGDNGM